MSCPNYLQPRMMTIAKRSRSAFGPVFAVNENAPGNLGGALFSDSAWQELKEAIAFHLDGLREEGQPVSEPHSYSAYVELAA